MTAVKRRDLVLSPFTYADNTCEFCRDGLHTSCPNDGRAAAVRVRPAHERGAAGAIAVDERRRAGQRQEAGCFQGQAERSWLTSPLENSVSRVGPLRENPANEPDRLPAVSTRRSQRKVERGQPIGRVAVAVPHAPASRHDLVFVVHDERQCHAGPCRRSVSSISDRLT